MKTLIYVLVPYMNGTKRLADALTQCCGIEGGHEIMGQGLYGSAKELPWYIGKRPYVNSGYGPEEESHGRVGDNKVADLYFEWASRRYTNQEGITAYQNFYSGFVMAAMDRYLRGNGFFADINCHLADYWPCVDDWKDLIGIDTRCVHLIRDGRMWAQRAVEQYKSFTGDGMHYGSVHNPETLYPYRDPKWRHEEPIIQAYHYWNDLHSWFMQSGARIFHLEKFVDHDVTDDLLMELYPEANYNQRHAFCRALERGSKSELNSYDAEAFEEICGDTMRRVGYEC